jgi:peptidoglycan/xylan/chitin deacetylase (PgdA/CDA1 family)
MDWHEIKEMQKSGLVKFGSHTVNHVLMDQVSLPTAQFEVQESQREISEQLGVLCDWFAYPNGNFNDNLEKLLIENQFKGAVTTQAGAVSKGLALMRIPRIGVHQDISISAAMLRTHILLGKRVYGSSRH